MFGSRALRHSADQPSSPRACARHSPAMRSSKDQRSGLPPRSQTKWNTSWTKTRGNSAVEQLKTMRRSRRMRAGMDRTALVLKTATRLEVDGEAAECGEAAGHGARAVAEKRVGGEEQWVRHRSGG